MRGARRHLKLALILILLMAPAQAQAAGRVGQPEAAAPPGGLILDRVVAVVNDEAVTLSEIQEEGQPVVRRIFQDFVGPERERRLEEVQQQVLNDLIDRRLMYQVAKREGMLPSTAEVNGAIEELKRNNKATDDAQFRAMLKAEGLTVEQVRRTIGERLAIGRLLGRQVRSTIILNEDELLKYYESNREKFQRVPQAEIRHIFFVPPPGGAGESAIRARAEEARAKIAAGADFAEVGRQYSDPSSGASGTETITVHRGELAPEIEAAAFGLPPGGVSPLIRTEAGLHLIKVERIQTETVAPFAEVRESIRDQLFQEKFDVKRKDWLASLRSRSSIQMVMQTADLHAYTAKP
jgi:peptidyl-prolyl cis-trans isomerase SurA